MVATFLTEVAATSAPSRTILTMNPPLPPDEGLPLVTFQLKPQVRVPGGKRSGYGVGGSYLVLYDFEKPFSWARDWVEGHLVDRAAEPRRGRARRPYSDRKGRNG